MRCVVGDVALYGESGRRSYQVDELLAGVDIKFCVDVLGVRGRSFLGDDQGVAHVRDGAAARQQVEDLGLARGECGGAGQLADAAGSMGWRAQWVGGLRAARKAGGLG